MDHFTYQQGRLHAEEVPLDVLANAVGTPFYAYSTATLTRHVEVLRAGLSPLAPRLFFAVKACCNIAVLRTLKDAGMGADVVSEGEIRAALAAGIAPNNIIFSGVGKTREEMRFALSQGIFQFNVESAPELSALNEVSQSLGKKARIAIRINPDVDARTHAKISTGKKENKFGVSMDEAPALYRAANAMAGIDVAGVSMHIGSQLTSLDPFREAFSHAREFIGFLRAEGIAIRALDIGGGLGVPYHEDASPPLPQAYGALVRELLAGLDVELMLEPGRLIAGNAGVMVTKVLYVKRSHDRTYVIVDAAMNDLMRPALYEAHHDIVPVHKTDAQKVEVDVVGPVCETGDTFATQRPLPLPAEGDLLAFRTAGAYGASMSSTYNSRPLIPEILVRGGEYGVTRPRQTYEELLGRERLAPWQG